MKQAGEFLGVEALGRASHDCFGGGQQVAVTREANVADLPQSTVVELCRLTQGVILAAVGIAGEVTELGEFTEDGERNGRAQGSFELGKSSDDGVAEELTEGVGGEEWCSHNVIVPSREHVSF
ncbi:MAG: hypothetical protein FJW39_26995 [Acidobacteria bacterium]|nr:hypothetical protein [Acidobacteriota bacterium]